MLGTGVHLELPDQPAAELVLGEHSPDGEFDGLAWIPIEQLTIRHGLQTAGSAGVTAGELVRSLLSGQSDLGRIHDDDEIAAVNVRGVRRLVLASKQCGGGHRKPAQHNIIGIDDMPRPRDVARFWAVGGHNRLPYVTRASSHCL